MRARWLLGAVVGGALLALPTPADAATYRYWSYWQSGAGDGAWSFATTGPGASRPADGAVEAWRFGTSSGTTTSSPPRSTARFADLCAGVERSDGTKRIGLVIDFGEATDAPPGERPPAGVRQVCAVVPDSATGARVLATHASIRTKDGLVCGIDGYPRSECAVVVADDEVVPRATQSPAPSRPAVSDAARAKADVAGARPGPATSAGSTDGTAPPTTTPATIAPPATTGAASSGAEGVDAGAAVPADAATADDATGRLPLPVAAGAVGAAVLATIGVDLARRRRRR
jgi:hypothetical protein